MTTYKCNESLTYVEDDGKDDIILNYPYHRKFLYIIGNDITLHKKDCAYQLDDVDEKYIQEKGYVFDDFHDGRRSHDISEQFLSKQITSNIEFRIVVDVDNGGVVGECYLYGHYHPWAKIEYGWELILHTGVCKSVYSAIQAIEEQFDNLVKYSVTQKFNLKEK